MIVCSTQLWIVVHVSLVLSRIALGTRKKAASDATLFRAPLLVIVSVEDLLQMGYSWEMTCLHSHDLARAATAQAMAWSRA